MRRTFATLLLVAAVLGACGESGEGDDAAANQAILAELPRYPHAEVDASRVAAYYEEGDIAPLGHTTNVDYRVPDGAEAAAVIRFYSSRLQPAWDCRKEGEEALLLRCKHGTAIVGVNTDNLGATPPKYELVVDHNDRTRYEPPRL